jgi:nucleoside 2-deoxyribosyltransferase
MRPPRRVYLAGPEVFLPDAVAVGARKKALCAAAGLDGVFPLDLGLALEGLDPLKQAHRIFDACESLMHTCDATIANATPFRGVSMDAGTAYEIGFMRALGRPVFVYTSAVGSYADRAALYRRGPLLPFDGDRPEVEVENFGRAENLMIAVAAERSGVGMHTGSDTDAAPRIGDTAAFEACLAKVLAHWTS